MKRFLAILLTILMSCTLFSVLIFAAADGYGSDEEWEFEDGIGGGSDENGFYYQYVGDSNKYYYMPYRDTEARVEDGVLYFYGKRGERLLLCDEIDLDVDWIQAIIDEYKRQNTVNGEVPEVMVFTYPINFEFTESVDISAPEEPLTISESDETVC